MKEKAKIILEENLRMIEKREEMAYSLYINCTDPTKSITNLAHSLNMTVEKFVKLVCSYINKHIIKPKYAVVLDKLDEIKEFDKDAIIEYFSNIEFSINFLENNLIPYTIYYRPDILLLPNNKLLVNLRKKINIYKSYLANKDIPHNDNLTKIEIAKNTITKFLSSDFSQERFLTHERISSQIFREYIGTIKTLNNQEKRNNKDTTTLYDIYINTLNKKQEFFNNNIETVIYNLFNLILELNNNFTSIDLFSNTIFGPNEILKAADNILSNEEMLIFRKHISPYKRIQVYSKRAIENLFKEKMIRNIDSEIIEIDNQLKLKAINYLIENNVPIFNDSFENACVREYRKTNQKHR